RNTYGKGQLFVWNIHRKNDVQVCDQESVIFKESQDRQVYRHCKPEAETEETLVIFLPVAVDLNTADIVEYNAEKHKKYIYRFSPCVEDQAYDKEKGVFQLPGQDEVKH